MKIVNSSLYGLIALAMLALGLATPACQHGGPIDADFADVGRESRNESDFKVTILGSGTPTMNRTQAGAAIPVEAGAHKLLFDCGRGCTTRLGQYNPALMAQIDKLFLTHLHSDHVVGAPDLWLNGLVYGRQGPLKVWGPPGVSNMVRGFRDAFAADLSYRNPGAGEPTPPALQDAVTTLTEDSVVVFDSDGVKVTAFKVNHAHIPAYGFRIDYGGKAVLISGDTTATPNLATYGSGADVVLLEVVSPEMNRLLSQAYSPAMVERIVGIHLTIEQASRVFAEIEPELGVYYHTITECDSDKALLNETGSYYAGAVKVARDLMQIRLFPDAVETELLAPNGGDCS